MESLYKSIGYLRGLADAMDIEDERNGKIVLAIIDCLDEMTGALNNISAETAYYTNLIDVIDEDLADLEDYVVELDQDVNEDLEHIYELVDDAYLDYLDDCDCYDYDDDFYFSDNELDDIDNYIVKEDNTTNQTDLDSE